MEMPRFSSFYVIFVTTACKKILFLSFLNDFRWERESCLKKCFKISQDELDYDSQYIGTQGYAGFSPLKTKLKIVCCFN